MDGLFRAIEGRTEELVAPTAELIVFPTVTSLYTMGLLEWMPRLGNVATRRAGEKLNAISGGNGAGAA